MDKKKLVNVIAAAAAIAFVTAPFTSTMADASAHKVKCYGVNTCKGHSKCKTAKNTCKGQNSCKGQGIVMKTEKQCKKLNGSTEEPTS